jgi:hypothetical protein
VQPPANSLFTTIRKDGRWRMGGVGSIAAFVTFGIEPFSPHDLRRTARTNMGQPGVPPHVSELVINHKKQGMVEVYDMWAVPR